MHSAEASATTQPIVEIKGLRKSYGNNEVLKGIDLTVEQGEVLCLIGPSGSGKSTFLRCVNHLEAIDAGRLWVGDTTVGYEQRGTKLYELSDKEICRQRTEVGMVFQHFNLFPHLTILENLTLAPIWVRKMPKKEAEEVAMHYLQRVRIPEQANKYPGQLSGGQQQRVAIARSLCMKPKIKIGRAHV